MPTNHFSDSIEFSGLSGAESFPSTPHRMDESRYNSKLAVRRDLPWDEGI